MEVDDDDDDDSEGGGVRDRDRLDRVGLVGGAINIESLRSFIVCNATVVN